MLLTLLKHGLARKWVHATAELPNPTPATFPSVLLACILTGRGEVVYVG